MKLHPRETMLAITTGFVILFGITLIVARPKLGEWKELTKRRAQLEAAFDKERKLLAKKDQWAKQFGELKKHLPEFDTGKRMDTYWMKIMDDIAAKHGLTLSNRQAGEEKRSGDVMELPIDCKEWEGPWASTVRFLIDLQSQGAMLDVRQLLIKPKEKDIMRGRFLLYCAYIKPAAQAQAPAPHKR